MGQMLNFMREPDYTEDELKVWRIDAETEVFLRPDGKYVVCTLTDESEIEAWEARELISGAAKWEYDHGAGGCGWHSALDGAITS